MGLLHYGNDAATIEFDDRALVHLKLVIMGKLRRGECFTLSWSRGLAGGGGRETLWLAPAIPLRFTHATQNIGSINRDWLRLLTESANRGDLNLVAEPVAAEELALAR